MFKERKGREGQGREARENISCRFLPVGNGAPEGKFWEFDLASILRRMRSQDHTGVPSRGWQSARASQVGCPLGEHRWGRPGKHTVPVVWCRLCLQRQNA